MDTPVLRFLLLTVAGWMNRRQQLAVEYLLAENRVLREQLGERRPKLNDAQRRRLAGAGKALGRKALLELATIATPDTILRWHRRLVANKYDGSGKRSPGRPRTSAELERLVVEMATDNPRWGYTRLQSALANLGHELGRTTIRDILLRHGLDGAPERGKRTSWRTFLRAHWGAVAATDFFTAEVLTLTGLVRYHVLFVIDLKSRRVEIAGIVQQPFDAWMANVARSLIDQVDGFLMSARYLIHDRDPLFSALFRQVLTTGRVQTIRLPARSPNLNAYAERFVRSIKEECLDRMVLLGEGHLRHAVREYLAHYHGERNHQGLSNALVEPQLGPVAAASPVHRRDRMGGLLRYYPRGRMTSAAFLNTTASTVAGEAGAARLRERAGLSCALGASGERITGRRSGAACRRGSREHTGCEHHSEFEISVHAIGGAYSNKPKRLQARVGELSERGGGAPVGNADDSLATNSG